YIFNYALAANGLCASMAYDITIEVISCICPDIFTGNPGPVCNQTLTFDLSGFTGLNIVLALGTVPIGQPTNILNAGILSTLDALPGIYVIQGSVNSAPPFCPLTEDLTLSVSDFKSAGIGDSEIKICELTDTTLQLSTILTGEENGGIWFVNPSINTGFDALTGKLNTKNLSNNSYVFKYIQLNALPCSNDTAQQVITILNTPIADAGKDQQLGCQLLEASLGGLNNPNIANVDFSWTGGILSDITAANPVTSDTSTFYLKLTDLTSGCSSSDSVVVSGLSVNELKVDFITKNPDCNKINGKISVIANGGLAPYLYSINGKPFQPLNEFDGLGEGIYKVQVQDVYGCELESNVSISGQSQYSVSLGQDTTIYFGDSLNLIPILTISPNEIDSIIWSSLGYLSCTDCLDIVIKPYVATLYAIKIFTKDGCILKANKIVRVKKLINIFVPNVFSPNADGINDHLEVFADPNIVIINQFLVFDRWGEKLFEANNINPATTNILWDGKFNGSTLNPGVYVYYLSARLIDGSEYIVKGDFTLLK
ncbi:MAG TPA: gliding motility-associated C-terminal domain-containing protein, partial [Saprospiraceae bacterium]|nr:gliding motility-associated C-terminal domain-containing protein [Saprospiraceae bacterium]